MAFLENLLRVVRSLCHFWINLFFIDIDYFRDILIEKSVRNSRFVCSVVSASVPGKFRHSSINTTLWVKSHPH